MMLETWLALVALLLAGYLATLHLSLIDLSRSAYQRRLAAAGREDRARWLLERRDAALLVTSLLRALAQIAVFLLILVGSIGPIGEAPVTWDGLLLAGGLAATLIWLVGGLIASSVARHAGPAVVAGSRWLIELIAIVGIPIARALRFVDEIVRRLSGANPDADNQAEEELLRSIEDSQLQGDLDPGAAELLGNVVEFRSTDVGEVMTPRTDIKGIELTDDLVEIRRIIREVGYSRIPVFEENLDHITGILYVKDLVPYVGEDASDFELRPLLRSPIMVPETKIVGELLADFQRSKVHMAIVIDEYGGTAGLVTIEDVLEELVGEIEDEHEPEGGVDEPSMTTVGESRVEVDGRFPLDDLNEELGLDLPEDEEFDTIGGFVLARLGRVPEVGDSFESHNARFKTIEATPTHVRRLEIELLTPVRANGDGFDVGK